MSLLGFYQKVESITADTTLNVETTIANVPAAENAVNTITLPPAQNRVGKEIYVFNNSLYAQKVAGASGDSINGQALVLPGQFIRYDSDGSDWYCLNPPGMQTVISVSVSAAQINAMRTTPISLVPAQGASRVIIMEHLALQIVRTATAFTGGGAVETRYTDTSGAKASADISSSFVTGGAGTAQVSVAGVTTELTPIANSPLVLTCSTQDFASGTGTAKARVRVYIADYN